MADTERSTAKRVSGGAFDSETPKLSRRFGRYVRIRKLGEGGMGEVYLAYDPQLDRQVTLKILRTNGRRFTTEQLEVHRTMLLNEARAVARLSHPNIVSLYDVGVEGDEIFLTMEYLPGQTLDAWSREPLRSWTEIVDVFVQIGRALDAAHGADIIHLDFKPANVIVNETGHAFVLDFGISQSFDRSHAVPMQTISSRISAAQSGARTYIAPTKSLAGTPAYMAPEQILGEPCSPATDQFSYFVSLFECLYSKRPYSGSFLNERFESIMQARIDAVRSRRGPAWLDKMIRKGLSAVPSNRFASMQSVVGQMVRRRNSKRRLVWQGALVFMLCALSVGVLDILRVGASRCSDPQIYWDPIWSSDRQLIARNAFKNTGAKHAAESWARVHAALSTYIQRWVELHEDACEAERVRGDGESNAESLLDRRMWCLQLAHDSAAGLISEFEHADAEAVRRSIAAVQQLPELDNCWRTENVEDPFRGWPEHSDTIRAYQSKLARIRTKAQAGRSIEALPRAKRLRAEILVVNVEPLLAEIDYLLGELHLELENLDQALSHLERAHALAIRSAHSEIAADAELRLGKLWGYRYGDIEQGTYYTRLARSRIQAMGNPARLVVRLAHNEGVLAGVQNDHVQSEAAFRLGFKVATTEYGELSISAAASLEGVALANDFQLRADVAVRLYRQAIFIREQVLGASKPR